MEVTGRGRTGRGRPGPSGVREAAPTRMAGVRERLFKVGVTVALLAAGVLLYLAATTSRDEEAPVRRGAILRVFPAPNTVALRQDAIGADLAFGHSAVLSIDNRRIPEDQLDVVQGINRWSFTPGEGKEIEELAEGRHCATVEYLGPPPAGATTTSVASTAGSTYSWCFTAA